MPSGGLLQESRVCGAVGGRRGWWSKECANRKVHSNRVKLDFQIQGITQSITVSGKLGRPKGGNNFLMEVAAENMQSRVNKAKRICLCTWKSTARCKTSSMSLGKPLNFLGPLFPPEWGFWTRSIDPNCGCKLHTIWKKKFKYPFVLFTPAHRTSDLKKWGLRALFCS